MSYTAALNGTTSCASTYTACEQITWACDASLLFVAQRIHAFAEVVFDLSKMALYEPLAVISLSTYTIIKVVANIFIELINLVVHHIFGFTETKCYDWKTTAVSVHLHYCRIFQYAAAALAMSAALIAPNTMRHFKHHYIGLSDASISYQLLLSQVSNSSSSVNSNTPKNSSIVMNSIGTQTDPVITPPQTPRNHLKTPLHYYNSIFKKLDFTSPTSQRILDTSISFEDSEFIIMPIVIDCSTLESSMFSEGQPIPKSTPSTITGKKKKKEGAAPSPSKHIRRRSARLNGIISAGNSRSTSPEKKTERVTLVQLINPVSKPPIMLRKGSFSSSYTPKMSRRLAETANLHLHPTVVKRLATARKKH